MNESGMTVPVIEKLQGMTEPTTIELVGAEGDRKLEVLAVPSGVSLRSVKKYLDEYLTRPERKVGTAKLTEVDSFIDHVNRTKTPNTVIFCDTDPEKPMLMAVYNYHEANDGGARADWLDHRAEHWFPLSTEWKRWMARDTKQFNQADFAAFLEDRILDVADPSLATDRTKEILEKMGGVALATPAKLLSLSKGLSVHVASKCENHVRIESGEVNMVFQTEHQDGDGAKLVVPGAFLLFLPLFRGGLLYPVICRLRYKVDRGSVVWSYALYRSEEMFDLAIKSVVEKVADQTELMVLEGLPESIPEISPVGG